MFGDFACFDDLPIKSAVSHRLEKGLKRFLIAAGIILGAELVWLFGVSPCIPLSTVEIKGFPDFDGAEVLRYAGIGEEASFFSVNTKEAERLLVVHPMVESVRVIKRFPDRLSIFLEPRRAVAVSIADIQGRILPILYDKYGVVFMIGNKTGESLPLNLPLVSGLVFENPAPGMRLPSAFAPLLQEFADIAEQAPELLEAISEIRINRKAFNGFDLLLYPVHYPIRVRLGENFNEETLRYVLLMLDVFKSDPSIPEEIDFRAGMGSYKIKEAPSGD